MLLFELIRKLEKFPPNTVVESMYVNWGSIEGYMTTNVDLTYDSKDNVLYIEGKGEVNE